MSKQVDYDALARSFLDLWQDQATRMARDPEMRTVAEQWMALFMPFSNSPGEPGSAAGREGDGFAPDYREGGAGRVPREDRTTGAPRDGVGEKRGVDDGSEANEAGTPTETGAAPAAALPDDRDAELERLAARVRELEERLAGLEPRQAALRRDLERQLKESGAAAAGSGASESGTDQAETDTWRAFVGAVDQAILERSQDLLDAVLMYRRHPYVRETEPAPVAWRAGSTALLDYGTRNLDGAPVLVVPSLINRYYILDLRPGQSLLRYLENRGFRPFVVDWDRPGPRESRFTPTDYVAGRLDQALDAVRSITGKPPIVLGYCMGGLLALALATRRQADIKALGLLATPWDFTADASPVAAFLPLMRPFLTTASDRGHEVGTDLLQALFHMLDPMLVIKKFLRFRSLDADGAEAIDFVALEDWLNDGVPMSGPVASEAFLGWYGDNTPARLNWKIAGRVVDPADVTLPTSVIIPSRDRIVPPPSAEALAAALPHAETLRVPLGHVGMMASSNAEKAVWEPLAAWMEETIR